MSLTPRTQHLRDRMVVTPAVCVERALYMTESYRETEGLPIIIRRAKAIENILTKMSIRIEPEETICGWETSKMRGGAVVPEVNARWLLNELDTVHTRVDDPYLPLSEEEKDILRDIIPYWDNKCVFDRFFGWFPGDTMEKAILFQGAGYTFMGHEQAHAAPRMEPILANGLEGTIADLDARMAAVDCTVPGELEHYKFYEGAKISQQAVIKFAHRYADLAEEMSKTEADPDRKAELLKMADTCRWVPEHPARDFYEAVQSAWFIYVVCMIESWGAGMSLGRLDQYLYPFYVKDIEEGKITKEEAQDLLALLMVKMNCGMNLCQDFKPVVEGMSVGQNGYPVMKGITIGGVKPDGTDAVNELTYLILDAEADVGLTSEDLVIRVNRINPDAYIEKAVTVAKKLYGKLKFVSDDSTISALLYLGLPIEYARDYISTGCHNPAVPGIAHFNGATNFDYPMMWEFVLTNGVYKFINKKLGVETGDPRQFKSYEEVENAFFKQVDGCLPYGHICRYIENKLFGEVIPIPLLSSFYKPCLESGKDIYSGGTAPYSVHVSGLTGIPNIADSLAAIKKLVFEEKKFTMSELIDALENNYEGEEGERILHLIKKAPKFGNDDDYVDQIARKIAAYFCDKMYTNVTYGGRRGGSACIAMTGYISEGLRMQATPDGRKNGEVLSEGGISPHQGRNVKGATATLNSVAKIDNVKMTNGSILNMRISTELVKDEECIKRFASMVRTFCETGGNLVQFNFSSTAMLRDAQKNPDKYRDLLVRVATYSSYFVELSPLLQENIIARTELG